MQSFWSTVPTNGVHPLWLYTLSGYAWVVSWFSASALHQAAFAVPLSLALLALGAANWIVVADKTGLPRAVLVVPQLLYLSVFGVLYSEAHASFWALSFLARTIFSEEDDGRPRPVQRGLAGAAVFLARLDSVFFVGFVGLWYLFRRRRSARQMAVVALAFALPAIAYLASNCLLFGGFVPVSGVLKSTFPTPYVRDLIVVRNGILVTWSGYSVPFGWLPLLVGASVMVLRGRSLRGGQTFLYPLWAGVACHALYIAFFTAGFTFWYWYYVLPVLLLSWSIACLATDKWTSRLDVAAQCAGVAVLVVALGLTRLARPTGQELQGLKTLQATRELGLDNVVILTSEWPGTTAFYSDNQMVAADMLTSNRTLVERMERSTNGAEVLFEEARNRGTPIQYVLYNGGIFLTPSTDRRELVYWDPRMMGNVHGRAIGKLQPGAPIHDRDGIVIWKLGP